MHHHQHPDDGLALSDGERAQFRRILEGLSDERPGRAEADTDIGRAHPGWTAMVIVCVLFVFFGLATNSVFLVLVAAGGAVGARVALRRRGD